MKFDLRCALIFGLGASAALPAAAQEISETQGPISDQVTTYDQTFFAKTQPSNALEMVQLLPGFVLMEGDTDLRGYTGAAGNVLIDGRRPAGKAESLETILMRVPSARVTRIELITAGSANYDMQGYALLANVVLANGGAISGRVEVGEAIYRHGFHASNLTAETTFKLGNRVIELLAAASREIDDEHGFGSRNRFSEYDRVLRLAEYSQPEGADIRQAKLTYRQPLAGGSIRLNGLLYDKRKFADIGYAIYFPENDISTGTERKHTLTYEGGLQFERPLGSANQIEVLGSYRSETTRGVDSEVAGSSNSESSEDSDASEAIARAVLRHRATHATIEVGAEGTINVLDSRNGLIEDGVSVPIPQAIVRVTEHRAEFFAAASGPLDAHTTLELGLNYETSRITQTSDFEVAKAISFWKPRFRLSWEPTAHQTIRLLLEREAGQLDFSDFVGAVSLTSGTISAGNADLEPESLWRLELSYERRFGAGSFIATVRREWLSDLVDQLPLVIDGTVYDAVGNIGAARRDEFEGSLKWPLDKLGVGGVVLTADVLARASNATDPSTGDWRRISGDVPLEARISVTHDIPKWNLRWGLNFAVAQTETSFKVREVEVERLAERLDVFIEYRPRRDWTIRLFGKNLTDSAATRIRTIYDGIRGGSGLRYRELRVLRSGPYVGVSIQYSFGK